MKYQALLLVLLFAGIVDSAYMVVVHFSPSALYCPQVSNVINCAAVLQSQYSEIFGVPLAVLGFVWTAVMLLLVRMKNNKMAVVINVWSIFGVTGVFYSLTSMAMLGEICAYCSVLDTVIVMSVLLIFLGARRERGLPMHP